VTTLLELGWLCDEITKVVKAFVYDVFTIAEVTTLSDGRLVEVMKFCVTDVM